MRSDVFQSRKTVHINFKKEVHAAFRTKMFERGLSMQVALEEFARLVAADDPRLLKVLDELARRRVQEQIAMLESKKPRVNPPVGELDQDTLYDLINEGK